MSDTTEIWIPGYDDVNPCYGLIVTFQGSEDDCLKLFRTMKDAVNSLSDFAATTYNQLLRDSLEMSEGLCIELRCQPSLVIDAAQKFGRKAHVLDWNEYSKDGEVIYLSEHVSWSGKDKDKLGFHITPHGVTFGVPDVEKQSGDPTLHFLLDEDDLVRIVEDLDEDTAPTPR